MFLIFSLVYLPVHIVYEIKRHLWFWMFSSMWIPCRLKFWLFFFMQMRLGLWTNLCQPACCLPVYVRITDQLFRIRDVLEGRRPRVLEVDGVGQHQRSARGHRVWRNSIKTIFFLPRDLRIRGRSLKKGAFVASSVKFAPKKMEKGRGRGKKSKQQYSSLPFPLVSRHCSDAVLSFFLSSLYVLPKSFCYPAFLCHHFAGRESWERERKDTITTSPVDLRYSKLH